MAAVRCYATTKAGTRCSITSLSTMKDSAGRLVAEPLRKGGKFCAMHTVLFPRETAPACEPIIAYIDLETSNLDVLLGKIVEIGALVDGSRATFSKVVHPGHEAPFLRYTTLSVLESDDDSEDGRSPAVAMKQDLQVCPVAHNGWRFDLPFLLSEVVRAGVGPAAMSSWASTRWMSSVQPTGQVSARNCNAPCACAVGPRLCCEPTVLLMIASLWKELFDT